MSTVYVLTSEIDCEGGAVQGVYASIDDAKVGVESRRQEGEVLTWSGPDQFGTWITKRHYGHWYEVTPYFVQGGASGAQGVTDVDRAALADLYEGKD